MSATNLTFDLLCRFKKKVSAWYVVIKPVTVLRNKCFCSLYVFDLWYSSRSFITSWTCLSVNLCPALRDSWMCCLYLDLSWDLCRMRLWCHCLFPLFYFNHLLKMSLIKSHNHNFFRAKLQCSEKVIFEPFEKEEGTNIEPRTEYHYIWT